MYTYRQPWEGFMLKEFQNFIAKGNVIDLAVAVIIGGAFGAIVTSLVNDIIMPIIGIILGGVNFSGLAVVIGGATVAYGKFIQAIVNFLIIAFVIFLVIQLYNRLRRKEEVKEQIPVKAELPADVVLLAEIRDLLKNNAMTSGGSAATAPVKPYTGL